MAASRLRCECECESMSEVHCPMPGIVRNGSILGARGQLGLRHHSEFISTWIHLHIHIHEMNVNAHPCLIPDVQCPEFVGNDNILWARGQLLGCATTLGTVSDINVCWRGTLIPRNLSSLQNQSSTPTHINVGTYAQIAGTGSVRRFRH